MEGKEILRNEGKEKRGLPNDSDLTRKRKRKAPSAGKKKTAPPHRGEKERRVFLGAKTRLGPGQAGSAEKSFRRKGKTRPANQEIHESRHEKNTPKEAILFKEKRGETHPAIGREKTGKSPIRGSGRRQEVTEKGLLLWKKGRRGELEEKGKEAFEEG